MIKKGIGMACMFYPNGSTGKANPAGVDALLKELL